MKQDTPISLAGLGLAYPPHILEQNEVRDLCREVFSQRPQLFDRMTDVYDNAGIETRNSCVPIDWYRQPHGWKERMALYEENALNLLEAATHKALADAGLGLHDIDSVVAISTTGIVTPSLDALLADRLGLRSDVARLPIFGLGCAGGVNGLARAVDLARSRPGTTTLCLVVELCALTFRPQVLDKSNIVASALFGDGAAALILESGENARSSKARFLASAEHLWPGSRDVMGWRIEEDGLGVIFSRDIPTLIEKDMAPIVRTFLKDQGIETSDLAGYIMHAGGTKVLEAYRQAIGVDEVSLSYAYDVLRQHGNMSAVTIIAVFERILAAGKTGTHLMAALGPGFSAGMMLVDL